MKKLVYALVAIVMLTAPFVTPAFASSCGSTYVVQPGDTLASIAANCGTTVYDILSRNPQIANPDWIYYGTVLTLTGDPVYTPGTYSGSTYIVQWGDSLRDIADRYGISLWSLITANPGIADPSLIYAGQVINLPYGTGGSYYSGGYYYPGYYYGTGGAYNYGYGYVTLSASSVKAGGKLTVTVSGFPANTDIDYRAGKQGEAYTLVVDGKTDANGSASATLTIPSSAVAGNYWVVTVPTTSIAKGVTAVSPAFLIIQ